MKKTWIMIASIALVIAVAGGIFVAYHNMKGSGGDPQAMDAFDPPPESAAAQTVAPEGAASLETPSATATPSATVTPAASETPAVQVTPVITVTPEPMPTPAATATPTPSPSPTPTPVPTPSPTPTPLPLEGLKIGIDPGHQLHANSGLEPVSPGSKEKKAKVTGGTSGRVTGTPEHEVNLTISLGLRDALTALGAEVKMTRETADVDVSNVERAKMMNKWGADLVLRLHCNGVSNSKANGIGLYVKTDGDAAKESLDFAKTIIQYMVDETGASEDGVFRRDIYSGLNWSTVPSILVEMGYMTNAREDKLLNDPAYQQKLITGMVKGVAACFDRSLNEEAVVGVLEQPAPSDPLDESTGE